MKKNLTAWYLTDQRRILGRTLVEAILDGWWDDDYLRCIDCSYSSINNGALTTVFYDYNHGQHSGHDWFYCDKCYQRDPTGKRYGGGATPILRSQYERPKTVNLKVIVKGQGNGVEA